MKIDEIDINMIDDVMWKKNWEKVFFSFLQKQTQFILTIYPNI